MNQNSLKGIIVPMITPLNDVDTLDIDGLEKLIEHILAGGVSGLFILGTTGEFSSLSYRLRYEIIERVCKIVNGRIPVLVGITDTAIVESINIADKAAASGANAVVAAPPYYFSTGQPELVEYFDKLVNKLPLPLFLYNMPTHTKIVFEPQTVKKIAENKNVIGLKDSSGNAVYFSLLQHAMKDNTRFSLFVGPEEITAELVLLGADGGVNGGANMFPKLYVDLYNAAKARNFTEIEKLQEKVLQISSGIYTVGKFGSSYMKGLKCALSVMGICNDFMAEPFHRFRKEEREKITQCLKMLDLPMPKF
ncbi:MAG: dihydrodipicolinate synthase family protein [Bacteroidales bacterium]|nr:dihydrodipicolinate synthase family protein [Bacteroidales bacterium]